MTIRKKEKKSQDSVAVPSNFAELIRDEIDDVRGNLTGNKQVTVSVVEARTHADGVICYHAMHNGVDRVLGNDTDFIAIAGKEMMLIKDFLSKDGRVECQQRIFPPISLVT